MNGLLETVPPLPVEDTVTARLSAVLRSIEALESGLSGFYSAAVRESPLAALVALPRLGQVREIQSALEQLRAALEPA